MALDSSCVASSSNMKSICDADQFGINKILVGTTYLLLGKSKLITFADDINKLVLFQNYVSSS